MRVWGVILLLCLIAGGFLYWKREPIYLSFLARKIEQTTLDERIELLAPSIDVRLPEHGAPPYPVVMQFHGCAGIRAPFMGQWVDIANEAGYAAVIVDSLKPRGLDRDPVCDGEALLGQERAGDIYAAVMIAKADPRLDKSTIVLAGWSHGGWSIMDYLTFDPARRAPPGLTNGAAAPAPAGVIFFYPYCGPGALSRFKPWKQTPRVLALIAGGDTIVNADLCIRYFENRRARDGGVEIAVYPGAEHVFDDPFLEKEYQSWYNEAYFEDAKSRYAAFLNALAPRTTQ